MLRLEAVDFRYPGAATSALTEVDVRLPDGTITGVTGPAEAGVTTLCRLLGGLAPRLTGGSLSGRLTIDDEDVTDRPLHALVDHVVVGLEDARSQLSLVADTVWAEVAFGPVNLGRPRERVVETVADELERLGLGDLARRDPRTLSGGQERLVLLGGLLAMRTRHLVLDEPFTGLDAGAAERVMERLREAAAEGVAILVATSDAARLERLAERILVLADGRVAAEGPPATILHDVGVLAAGIREPPDARVERVLRETGLA